MLNREINYFQEFISKYNVKDPTDPGEIVRAYNLMYQENSNKNQGIPKNNIDVFTKEDFVDFPFFPE